MAIEFEIVDEKSVPAPPKQLSDQAKQYHALVASLKPGKVAKIPLPEDGKTRGIKIGISRAAGKGNIVFWQDDQFLYVKQSKGKD